MKKQMKTLLIAAALAAASGLTMAQMDGGMMDHGGMHGDPAKMEQLHAKHLAELKAKLKISASQEAAWNTFTAAMKPPADMGKRPDRAELDKLTTPERIDKMKALHKEHMAAMDAAMEKRGEATKAFYAALTPEQQKTFDGEHQRMMQRGERGHRMDHGDAGGKPAQPPKQ